MYGSLHFFSIDVDNRILIVNHDHVRIYSYGPGYHHDESWKCFPLNYELMQIQFWLIQTYGNHSFMINDFYFHNPGSLTVHSDMTHADKVGMLLLMTEQS